MLRPKGRAGNVLSPRHTLPPNTTCTYHFRGRPGDLVWLYFVSYSHQPLLTASNDPTPTSATTTQNTQTSRSIQSHNLTNSCSTRLRIWDGGGTESDVLLADHCDLDPPRLCDHTSLSNVTRVTRPCSPLESYVSTGPDLTMRHYSEDGTALHPATFRLKYEFVDTRMGGESWSGRRGEEPPPQPCSRVFRKTPSGDFSSPRNVFLFGRGGAKNLSCVYRIEAGSGEKIRLTLHNASFGETSLSCGTEHDPHTGRPKCASLPPFPGEEKRVSQLRILEVPWRDVKFSRACLCDNSTLSASGSRHIAYTSSTRIIELHFTVTRLNITEDFVDLYFHASFEIVRAPDCSRKQRLRGSGGEIEFVSPPRSRVDIYCEGLPWLVEAHENRSLFLLTWGTFLPLEPSPEDPVRCHTTNRVLLYSGRPAK